MSERGGTTARGVALRALQQLEKGRIDRIADELDRARLEPRDRALANDLATGVVRNERFLDFVLSTCVERRLPKDPRSLAALRLGAFQLLLLPGMPQRAAVHETVALLQREQAFVNAVLRRLAAAIDDVAADAQRPLLDLPLSPTRTLHLPPPGLGKVGDPVALRHSLPEFLVARWRARHGEAAAAAIATAASAVPALFLRACGGRSAAELIAALAADGVQAVATAHPLVVRCDSGAPFGTAAFRDGAFVAQDPTAVAAAEAVGAAPGMTIVDLCAAPGTKSTLLAERVQPDGVVFAWDRDAARRGRIGENARRLRLEPWLRVVDDPAELPLADAVLADVPCSNSGVLARRVEVRRRLSPSSFAELAGAQRQLLTEALARTRAGGRTVYSTCSIEPEENEDVAAAVAAATGAAIVASQLTLPAVRAHDGGYFAVMRPGAAAVADGGAAGVPAPGGRG